MTTPAQHTAFTPLKLLAGTYEHSKQVKIVPEDQRNPLYIMVGGRDIVDSIYSAEHIVRACNSYPDLLEACKAVCAALGDISNGQHERGLPTEDVNKISRAFFQAQRALARAEQSSPREGKE